MTYAQLIVGAFIVGVMVANVTMCAYYGRRERRAPLPVGWHLMTVPGGILWQTWHPDNVDAREICRDRAEAEAEAEAETTIGRDARGGVPLSAPLIPWPVPKRGER